MLAADPDELQHFFSRTCRACTRVFIIRAPYSHLMRLAAPGLPASRHGWDAGLVTSGRLHACNLVTLGSAPDIPGNCPLLLVSVWL